MRIKVNDDQERKTVVNVLAENGYRVWIETDEAGYSEDYERPEIPAKMTYDYFVCAKGSDT